MILENQTCLRETVYFMLKSMRIAVLWYCMASQICEHIFRLLTVLKAVLKNILKGCEEWQEKLNSLPYIPFL